MGCSDGHLYAIDSGTNAGLKNTPWPMFAQNPRHTSNAADYKEPVSVDDTVNEKPSEFYLKQNSPNPFNQSTLIQYSISENSNVRLDIYNLSGQKVKTLVDKVQGAGQYKINFDANNLPSGIYFSKLKTKYGVKTQKMMLVK